jgi:hypothetical protein
MRNQFRAWREYMVPALAAANTPDPQASADLVPDTTTTAA